MAINQGKAKRSVALVVPDLSMHSGVPTVALFLHRVISASGRYTPEMISVSTSARDANSTRISSPASWLKPATVSKGTWNGIEYSHVGAEFTELEFQRYRPRRVLTDLLNRFDLVQVVAGCPPWALLTKDYAGKVALQVATLTAVERASMLKQLPTFRRWWLSAMTRINTSIEGPAIRRADVVFVENKWMFDLLSAEHGSDKVVFAPPGIDADFFQPAGYQKDGYLLSVGRFNDPRKNVRMLFDAYSRLRKERPDAPRLVLAGEVGPLDSDLDYAESLGITRHLEIFQKVPLEKLRSLYQNAALFLLSSNEEGFGLVIAEAMACGLPVVSTGCGGPETLVVEGVTGHLTPVGDAEALKKRVAELLDDPEKRARFGAAGRARAVDKFSLEAAGKIFLQRYDALLGVA
jgi:glycosyltransferase involved in cell wall biosynthesis